MAIYIGATFNGGLLPRTDIWSEEVEDFDLPLEDEVSNFERMPLSAASRRSFEASGAASKNRCSRCLGRRGSCEHDRSLRIARIDTGYQYWDWTFNFEWYSQDPVELLASWTERR
jgi:hypothetical protein